MADFLCQSAEAEVATCNRKKDAIDKMDTFPRLRDHVLLLDNRMLTFFLQECHLESLCFRQGLRAVACKTSTFPCFVF